MSSLHAATILDLLQAVLNNVPNARELDVKLEHEGEVYDIKDVVLENGKIRLVLDTPTGGPIDYRKKVVAHKWDGMCCVLTLECGCTHVRYKSQMRSGIPETVKCRGCK